MKSEPLYSLEEFARLIKLPLKSRCSVHFRAGLWIATNYRI
jgi:hypothetical protein